jgi:hypothetical protein
MEKRNITLVTYRTLDPVELEVDDNTTCALCSSPAIGGMVFPDPYELDEERTVQGNVVLCSHHIDELTIDSKPI